MEKRGQVTVFIIIGIVILLAISGYVYAKDQGIFRDLLLPEEMKPVVKYSEACIQRVAQDGIIQMGIQGGYLYLPDRIMDNPNAYIDLGFKVPYWFYLGEDRMPSKRDMEQQLARYIQENANICLNDFEAFSNTFQFDDIELSIDVDIGSYDVRTKTDVSGSITQIATGRKYTFPKLQTRSEYNLGELYDLAKEIMELENNEAFLEGVTYDLIAASDYLPTEGIEITCAPRIWQKSKIREYLKTLLSINLQLLRYNVEQPEVGIPYYDNLYTFDMSKNYKASVDTIYNPNWNMELQITPNQGSIVKPFETPATEVTFNCFKLYHHLYSLEYPVMFKLSSKQNTDLSFFFATPVILTKNQPNRDSSISFDIDEVLVDEEQAYCEDTQESITNEILPNGEVIFRTETVPRRTNSLRVRVFDITKQSPDNAVVGADVSYQCVRIRCPIGKTSYVLNDQGLVTGETPQLRSLFPDCGNGFIIVEKEGYHKAMIQQTVSQTTNNKVVNVNMVPLKELVVNVLVKLNDGTFSSLSPTQSAIIIVKNDELDFNKQFVYPSEDQYTFDLLAVPTTYDVQVILVDDNVIKGMTEYEWKTDNIWSASRAVFFVPILERRSGESDDDFFVRLYENQEELPAELR